MFPSFASQTVQIEEAVLVNRRGKMERDWTQAPAKTTTVPGCSVQPGASDEVLAGRQGVTVQYTVLMPPGYPITAHSAVRYQGTRYQVDGEPKVWPSPTGGLDHIDVLLIDWKG